MTKNVKNCMVASLPLYLFLSRQLVDRQIREVHICSWFGGQANGAGWVDWADRSALFLSIHVELEGVATHNNIDGNETLHG